MTSVYKAWNACNDYDAPKFYIKPKDVNRGGFTLASDVAFRTCNSGVRMQIVYMACGKF